jgi:hypothetical protein
VNLDYIYDIGGDSIFATPEQASLFASPYGSRQTAQQDNQPIDPFRRIRKFAKGGQVEDDNDRLLKMLGEIK